MGSRVGESVARHTKRPIQYIGFVLIMYGFLLQWPTIHTLIMFPILVFMYMRLARYEEVEVPSLLELRPKTRQRSFHAWEARRESHLSPMAARERSAALAGASNSALNAAGVTLVDDWHL